MSKVDETVSRFCAKTHIQNCKCSIGKALSCFHEELRQRIVLKKIIEDAMEDARKEEVGELKKKWERDAIRKDRKLVVDRIYDFLDSDIIMPI